MARHVPTPDDAIDSANSGALKRLTTFAVSTLLTTGGLFLLRLVKNVVFTRLLGPMGRGVFSLLTTVPELVVSVGNLGFGLGSIYLIAKKRADLKIIVGNAAAYLLLHGLLLMIAGFLLLSHEGFLKETSDLIADFRMIVVIAVWLMLAYHLGMDLLTGIKDIHFLNGLRLLYSALPTVVMLLLWLLFDSAIWAGVSAWLFTVFTVVILTGYRLLRISPGRPGISLPLLKKTFSFGLRGNVSMFANAVVRRVDVLFIAYYHGAEAVGLYAVGVSVAEILLAVPEAVALPFLPIRLEMTRGDASSFSSFTIKYVLLFMVVACSVTAIFSKWIIVTLYGEPFLRSTIPLLWLLPGILALSIYQFLKADFFSLNRPGFISWVSVFTMVCNLLLNYLTIPAYGIAGAAASSSVSYILSTAILIISFLKTSGRKPSELLVVKKTELSVVACQIRNHARKLCRRKTDDC